MANFSQVIEELSGAGYTEAEAIQATVALAKIPNIEQLIKNSTVSAFVIETLINGFQPISDHQKVIVDGISKFSPREKQCYFMYTIERMSMGNIAKEIGVSKGSVQSMISRARKKLDLSKAN